MSDAYSHPILDMAEQARRYDWLSKRPLFALAPMDDVTDSAFRQLIAELAPPDVFFTEFASVDGLSSDGRSAVMKKLKFTEKERPIVAQVWGLNPENYYLGARKIVRLGFDGIDINMGCPVKKVVKIGACSALINNRDLAAEIVLSTAKAVKGRIPLSVKTRLGFDRFDLSWFEFLLDLPINALTVHGRTVKQMSKAPADWSKIAKVAELRNKVNPEVAIIGNGDVVSLGQGKEYAARFGVDGIMIGRGIFKDPYIFSGSDKWKKLSKKDKIKLFQEHLDLFSQTWSDKKPPAIMKKFAKIYLRGFRGAKSLREQVIAASSLEEMRLI